MSAHSAGPKSNYSGEPYALWGGLSSILGCGKRIRYFAVLYAYLDESGIPDIHTSCVIAGHVGTRAQWRDFDKKWREGLGNRKGLHMRKLRWNNRPEKIGHLLATLGPIPDACGLERVFGVIRGDEYLSVVGHNKTLRLLASPYMMAMHPCINQTLRHVPADECVMFIFERQDRYSVFAEFPERFYGSLYRTPAGEPRVIISYLPKGAIARTQPADYLAYQIAQVRLDSKSQKAKLGAPILGDWQMIGADVTRVQMLAIAGSAQKMLNPRKRRIKA